MEKTLQYNMKISNVERFNPLFSKADIYVMYEGHNRNGSYMSEDTINKAIPSIYNIPIVGQLLKDKKNFGDHAMDIEVDDDGEIEWVSNTKAYGIVPESAQVEWENVTEDDGTTNRYLKITGAYLWTGRYPEIDFLLNNSFGQSMEINLINAREAVIDSIPTFEITEFVFSGLCILGIDKDGEGHVEPAFESASIKAYNLDKDTFKSEFNQMVAELKFSLENDKGGHAKVTEKQKNKNGITINSPDGESVFISSEGIKTTDGALAQIHKSETLLLPSQTEKYIDTTELISSLKLETYSTDAPTVTNANLVVENFDENPVVEDVITDIQEDVQSEDVVVSEDQVVTKVEDQPEDVVSIVETLRGEIAESESKIEALQAELDSLRGYKRNREESDLRVKFESQVTEQEFDQLFSENANESIETIEDKIYSLIGKKNFSLPKAKTVEQKVNKQVVVSPVETETNPYGDIFN